MIISKTHQLEGYEITQYQGVVFGEVIAGVNFIKDFAAGLTNFFGGRSSSYEGELIQARENALQEMITRATDMGADAVVGVTLDYETLGEGGTMLMVTASGTPVKIRPKQ